MKLVQTLGLLFSAACFTANAGIADIPAVPLTGGPAAVMPADTKLVVFQFDPNATYTILSRPNAITDIQLGPDEQLSTLAIGDSVSWTVAKTDGLGSHIFIKPLRPDLFTSGTLVTTKRTYQLTFRSTSEKARWYQRVTWNYPEIALYQNLVNGSGYQPSNAAPRPGGQLLGNSPQSSASPFVSSTGRTQAALPGNEVPSFGNSMPAADRQPQQQDRNTQPRTANNYASLNYEYKIEGKAPFKPVVVFDDGQFTWFQIPSSAQEAPAIFMLDKDGEMEIVNFVNKDKFIVVQRLADAFLLKLGKEEVRVFKGASKQ